MSGNSFWDRISGVYDLFERAYNRKCYDGTDIRIAKEMPYVRL